MAATETRMLGRYATYFDLASGGMASVHFGRHFSSGGFAKSVAIKRLHPHLAKDPVFVTMFLDEARLAARIRHPNVVSTLDVIAREGDMFLVMEYVEGEVLSGLFQRLWRTGGTVPLPIALNIVVAVLTGLHAAHEARSETGDPLGIVHRDVSPQNVMVGVDGVARVVDFGIAKATYRMMASTGDGKIKGKLAYMSPEQLLGLKLDRRSDVYGASVLAWELLTVKRLFGGDSPEILAKVLKRSIKRPRLVAPGVPEELDAIVMNGLHEDPDQRFATAEAMAEALERFGGAATNREVGQWVKELASEAIQLRAERVSAVESSPEKRASMERLVAAAEAPTKILTAGHEPESASGTKAVSGESGAGLGLTAVSEFRRAATASRRQAVWIGVVGLAIAAATLLLFVFRGTHFKSAKSEPNASSEVPSRETKSVESVAGEPKDPTPPPPSTIYSAPASAASFANPSPSSWPRIQPAPRTASTAIAKPKCEPPFLIDREGIRRWKPECQ